MKKTVLFFIVIFICALAGAQSSDSIYLDPIETTPVMPSSYSMEQNGNWGVTFTGINKYFDIIEKNAKRRVAVFVFDTGGKMSHSALQQAMWPEHGAVFTGEQDAEDGNGHATHVAGIYGALHPTAFVGVAAPLVRAGKMKIIAYKVLSNQGSGSNTGIYAAMTQSNELAKKLIKEGWFVIYNFSLGAEGTNAVFDSLMKIAFEAGVLIVGAAGNDNTDRIITPANGPHVFAIGAMNPQGEKAYFSTYGKGLWLVSPGQGIFSTFPPNTYMELSGTSMATPFQGAICAIVASLKEDWTNRDVAAFLEKWVKDIPPAGWDEKTGYGYSDAATWFPRLDIGDKPEEPVDPPKNKRDVTIIIDLVLPVKWKPLVEQDFRYAQSQIIISVKNTGVYAHDLSDQVRSSANKFYNDHLFFLTKDADFIDAGYWAGQFFRNWMRENQDTNIDIEEVIISDGYGRKAIAPTKSAIRRTWIRMMNPEIGYYKN